MTIHTVRKIARDMGIKSPTTKKKAEIIEEYYKLSTKKAMRSIVSRRKKAREDRPNPTFSEK